MNYFEQQGLIAKYYPYLKRYSETRMHFAYNVYSDKIGEDFAVNNFKPKIESFFSRYFIKAKRFWEYEFWLIGSFSSRWIVHQIGIDKNQLVNHIPFSSIIAQMSKGENLDVKVENKDIFRKEAIYKDYNGDLQQLLIEFQNKPDFFIIDFMEERYDIGRLEDGNYITLSDAYNDSDIDGIKTVEIINAGSNEFLILWKNKCNKFIYALKEFINPKKIILIRSRLALMYNNGKTYVYYENHRELEKLNIMFEDMEEYFISMMGTDIQVYEMPKRDIYTPYNLKYGIQPEYWNQEIYRRMVSTIRVSFDK